MNYLFVALVLAAASTAQAQTVTFDPSAPVRGGAQNQTSVPPINPALNQSTIQGPSQVQRTTSSYDAQPSRLPAGSAPVAGTPEQSPTALPDVREQPLVPQRQQRRQSTDIVPNRGSSSSNASQQQRPHPQAAPLIMGPQYNGAQ